MVGSAFFACWPLMSAVVRGNGEESLATQSEARIGS